MSQEKNAWKSRLGAFIPQHIPNRMVCGGMSLLGILHRTRRVKSEENREHNLGILGSVVPNTYIENQPQWKDVCFGNKSTMAYSGCEILAVYNALFALREKLIGEDLVELINEFERKGAVWAGLFGTAPRAICRYFEARGYRVRMLYAREEEAVNSLGEESDALIATVYNDAHDIFKMIHTVSISKDATGNYHAHNCYKVNSKKEFVSDGPFDTLWAAIHNIGRGNSALLCAIGISKNPCTGGKKEV